MRAVSTFTAIGAALWIVATSAHALGFGRVSNTTQLGQPLNFVAQVRLDADESLTRECVAADVLSGENRLAPERVRVSVEGPADAGERRVRVVTVGLIDEPVVTVSITLGCTAQVTRTFVAFIDPPVINLAQANEPAAAPPPRTEAGPPPVLTARRIEPAAPASTPTRRAERRAPHPRPNAPRTVHLGAAPRPAAARSAAAPARTAVASRQSAAAERGLAGPQLKLEAAPVLAAKSVSAAASAAPDPAAAGVVVAAASAAPTASAASAADDATAQLAQERQRVQQLEQGLAALRSEAQASQKAFATLQARVREAETQRYANPLVYLLAALAVLLALAAAWLWRRQARGGAPSQWWATPGAAEPRVPAAPGPAPAVAPVPAPAPVRAAVAQAFEDIAVAEPVEAFTPATIPAPEPAPPAREFTVEELIDLEQQVEFFIVLGQDDAAVDLLMSHVRGDGGSSPLPYLKLLEIYRRRGEHEEYDRIRERFNRRFNAVAPRWEADAHEGRTLDDYPEASARLQRLWSDPVRVMETLQASLFRRKGADETFDLPAYRELLFLYSIARDLAEHGSHIDTSTVDLLLPLDEPVAAARPAAAYRPAATEPPAGGADSGFVDFDLRVPASGGEPPRRR